MDDLESFLNSKPSSGGQASDLEAFLGESPSLKTGYGFSVKPFTINTQQGPTETVQREDGAIWMDKTKGWEGAPGWKFQNRGQLVPAPAKPTSQMGWFERNLGPEAWASMGRNLRAGASKPGEALQGLIMREGERIGAVDPQSRQAYEQWAQQRQGYRQALQDTSGTGAALSQITGEAIPQIAAMALTKRMLPSPVGLGQSIAANTIATVPTAYATTPGDQAQRAKSAAIAGGLSAAGEAALAGVGKVAGLFKTSGRTLPPAMQELEDIAAKHGVSTDVADLAPEFAKRRDMMRQVPMGGYEEVMATKQAQADEAAKKLLDQLKSKVDVSGATKTTPSGVAMAAGRSNLLKDKMIGHDLYDAVGRLAGEAEIAPANQLRAIQEEMTRIAKGPSPNQAKLAELSTRAQRLMQTADEAVTAGQMPMDRTYAGIRESASDYYKAYKAADKAGDAVEAAVQKRLHSAALQDLQEFADSSDNPALKSVHKLANDWWKDKVKQFSTSSMDYANLAKQLKGSDVEPEKVMDYFIKANNDDLARYFYNALDDNGRNAVKWGIVDDAYKHATRGGDAPFNPSAFANYMTKYKDASGVFFKGADKMEIDGFTKLMKAISEAGTANQVSTTGKSAIGPMIAGSQIAGLGGLGAAAVTGNPAAMATAAFTAAAPTAIARFGKWAFTSPAGKKLLLGASAAKPGSPMMNNYISQFKNALAAQAGEKTEE